MHLRKDGVWLPAHVFLRKTVCSEESQITAVSLGAVERQAKEIIRLVEAGVWDSVHLQVSQGQPSQQAVAECSYEYGS